jgi:preprotein translocase subunit secB
MEVRSKYESPLRLEKIEIVESTFRKKDESTEHLELGVQVERSLKKISDKVFEVLLETTVSDEDEKVFVNVKGKAIFSTEQENMDILEKNTIAIMFPYIRSYISIITTQPGMNPIVLPAMNIVAIVNDQKK